MRIHIKTLTGRILELDVDRDETIANLKQKISDLEGIPPGQQMLVYDGKLLGEFYDGDTQPKKMPLASGVLLLHSIARCGKY